VDCLSFCSVIEQLACCCRWSGSASRQFTLSSTGSGGSSTLAAVLPTCWSSIFNKRSASTSVISFRPPPLSPLSSSFSCPGITTENVPAVSQRMPIYELRVQGLLPFKEEKVLLLLLSPPPPSLLQLTLSEL